MVTRCSEDARPTVLIGADLIRRRIKRLGKIIGADFANQPLTVVAISTGAMIFASDLVRAIDLPLQLDSISAHSYEEYHRNLPYVGILQERLNGSRAIPGQKNCIPRVATNKAKT